MPEQLFMCYELGHRDFAVAITQLTAMGAATVFASRLAWNYGGTCTATICVEDEQTTVTRWRPSGHADDMHVEPLTEQGV
jgi:hypothetical protein